MLCSCKISSIATFFSSSLSFPSPLCVISLLERRGKIASHTETITGKTSRKRRNRGMEAKNGEVRRLQIIYFLSCMGCIEQPHLIRVHHLTRNGVNLRDVKRWLADLRGKDMPETFAWSYKRRYKTGYVWQDLVDDDLITPISDNEYVLKGSQINPNPIDTRLLCEKKAPILAGQKKILEDNEHQQIPSPKEELDYQTFPDSKIDTPFKFSSEISQESPPYSSERSTTTDEYDSSKLEEEKKNPDHGQSYKVNLEKNSSPFHLNQLSIKNYNEDNMDKIGTTPPANSPSTPSPTSFTKSKSGASNMFRNLITCRRVDTKDAVVVFNRVVKTGSKNTNLKPENKSEICKGDNLGGPGRFFGASWNHQQQQQYSDRKSYDGAKSSNKTKKKKEFMNQKTVSPAYKPVGGPNCSQCGKSFRPEKMNKHMKYCRGMKTLGKAAADPAGKTSFRSSNASSYNEDSSSYLLTN
ncbi:Protein UPSTREAM OF FLC [Quillaja saponaria]|uniref:Protein UPSTREAM OF FLC n=1 Tax=Quillaja saponaria TaxID=32244 RepID=A0AAD7VNK7_QUISA|nr:Protein UPSTREAM OF FLC [Quillaja saponaria]